MSKIGKTLLMFAVGLLMTACSSVMAGGAVAPSGNTVSEEMSLGNFDKIVVNGSFEVTYETSVARVSAGTMLRCMLWHHR